MRTTDFNPDGSQELQTIQTYDKYAESWAAGERHHDRKAVGYDAVIAQFKKRLAGGTVLEIGAGGGWDGELLEEAGYKYLGTDASLSMVKAAQKTHPELQFKQLNVYDLQRLGQQFDGFWACAVLLHIPKRRIDEALQAIVTVTKSGGVGFISMKDGDREEFERREKAGRKEERLFAYWPRDEFEQALQRHGFTTLWYEHYLYDERTKWHRFIVRRS